DAIEELDLSNVVRTMERTRSLLRFDGMIEGGAGDVADESGAKGGIAYPEWDYRRGRYRHDWCRVHVRHMGRGRSSGTHAQQTAGRVAALRRESEGIRTELERLKESRRWRGRELDGSEVDEDAMVDRHTCLHAGT